jgi:fructosamine-3-kinase
MGGMLAGETSRREMNPKRLTTWLRRELGLELQAMAPVGGGCIHRAWCLKLQGGRRLFAKSNRAELLPVLEAEAEGLRALAAVAEAATTEPAKPPLTAPPWAGRA